MDAQKEAKAYSEFIDYSQDNLYSVKLISGMWVSGIHISRGITYWQLLRNFVYFLAHRNESVNSYINYKNQLGNFMAQILRYIRRNTRMK